MDVAVLKACDGAAEIAFHAAFLYRADDILRKKVHIGKRGRAGTDHLGDRKQGGIIGVLAVNLILKREYPLVEPPVKRQILRITAQKRHGRVGMGIDKAAH